MKGRVRRWSCVATMLLLIPAAVQAQRAIAPDFASMRGEADAAAAKSVPGANLHQVDLMGRIDGSGLRISQGYFFYIQRGQSG